MTNSGTESPTYVLVSMQEALNYASMEPTTIGTLLLLINI